MQTSNFIYKTNVRFEEEFVRVDVKEPSTSTFKAKVSIIHQKIHWLLTSDKGIFEYLNNFHCVPAYLYLSVIMVFRVYPET